MRPSFIPERDGRLVTQAPSLEERDPVDLVLRLGNYRHCTATLPLALDLVLGMYRDDGATSQYHLPDYVKIDESRGVVI